ncbi:MAG: DUF4127 family protein [Fimbriimonadaceae bacterium]|nr:DUF4127 family protein [Fimbriimonadaceae bacterium]
MKPSARLALCTALTLGAAAAFASPLPRRILVIPLDDRPASAQLPAMIAGLAGAEVVMPPRDMLGRFDRNGDPERILAWLRNSVEASRVDAAVVSLDMLVHGGLIGSRAPELGFEAGRRRLMGFWAWRQSLPQVPVYAFSAITRLAPTATLDQAPWRMQVARLVELESQWGPRPTAEQARRLQALRLKIPAQDLVRYRQTRRRNLDLARTMIQILGAGGMTHLAFGQDDAAVHGPHRDEQARLESETARAGLESRTTFLQGIDQVASVLVARAIVQGAGAKITVEPRWADPAGAALTALYESEPVAASLRGQVQAAGAEVGSGPEALQVHVNTPGSTPDHVEFLTRSILADLQAGRQVGLADINLGKAGIPDARLTPRLLRPDLFPRLGAWAGWNTAANTMGTVIPAMIVREAARIGGVDPGKTALETRRLLLHRLITDWHYHAFTRPLAFAMIDGTPAPRESLPAPTLSAVEALVRRDLAPRAQRSFHDLVEGDAAEGLRITALQSLDIRLPWPRAYEVEVDFQLLSERTR